MTTAGWVTNRCTEALYGEVAGLLGGGAVSAVGLPRYSLEQTDKVKGATKYVNEVVSTYEELEPFRGITEAEIRTGVDIWVRHLAPSPECVLQDEHVGYVVRRGDVMLVMIDSSGVNLYLDLPGFGPANAASQLMIQLTEAVRHARDDGRPPSMLMPEADDRDGRNTDQIRAVQKFAKDTEVVRVPASGGSRAGVR
jgi:hypothetical protein